MRKGFSLPELLVALVLLNVGLLALVALGGATVRVANDAMGRSAAVAAAVNRIELLAAPRCDGSGSGTAPGPRGVRERWAIETAPQGGEPATDPWRKIVDSVTYPHAGAERTIVLQLSVPC